VVWKWTASRTVLESTIEQTLATAITEYDQPFVRRLIEKVTVYVGKFIVEFKSGVTVDVDE
jgi:hypothetical protein